jgi:hypothetical protein
VETTLKGITGHPRTVVSTQNSSQGKVYVASPDSDVLTIIRTDQDIVDTIIPITGNIVDVRVTSQNGTSASASSLSGSANLVSRVPGFGQPCNLPLSEFDPATNPTSTTGLANCQAQDTSLLQ